MKRIYTSLILDHLKNWEQMVFIEGPRQAGKTTIAKEVMKNYELSLYLNWDNIKDRSLILKEQAFVEHTNLITEASNQTSLIIFDEIHKMPNWKNYLKGFYDTYKEKLKIIATGSSKLSIYKKGQDSLMGRYFNYTIYPISIGELLKQNFQTNKLITPPSDITKELFQNLFDFGGFPDPFLKKSDNFHNRWAKLRRQQLFTEDISVVEDIKNIQLLETLAYILKEETTFQLNYSKLAAKIQVSDQTIKKWLNMLEKFYYGFTIKPWYKNVIRSIVKEPKFYLLDWSNIRNIGKKTENFIACHLKKAVHFWNDLGDGEYNIYYLRDKEKREVDFAITKNDKVWFLVEVKHSNNSGLSKNLEYFRKLTNAKHAFQVILDMPSKNIDCFEFSYTVKVPAITFLSQLP